MGRHRIQLCAFAVALTLFGCSNRHLQPNTEDVDNLVDDLLEANGKVCTDSPDDTVFPVKILIISDSSGSMQFTDPSDATNQIQTYPGGTILGSCGDVGGMTTCEVTCWPTSTCGPPDPTCLQACTSAAPQPGRQKAIADLVQRYKNNTAVEFAIIRFNGAIVINDGTAATEKFIKGNDAVLQNAISGLAQADIVTDYQGALSSAVTLLERDMLKDPSQNPRTKYVVIFFSDGSPNPKCVLGCDPTIDGPDLPGSQPDFCNATLSDWCGDPNNAGVCQAINQIQQSIGSAPLGALFPAMTQPCGDYNSDDQIITQVKQMLLLAEEHNVAELRLNTAHLWNDSLDPAIMLIAGLIEPAGPGGVPPQETPAQGKLRAETLLKAMAVAGNGQFRSFSSGGEIDFLDINYTSVARPFGLTNFFVYNLNVIATGTGLAVDTDGDGLSDEQEFELGLDKLKVDTDGDGYTDLLEYQRLALNFDPNDPAKPSRICNPGFASNQDRGDRDGDGLRNCEESAIGTDPLRADTDKDRVIDGIELRVGTDPLVADMNQDVDFDGKLSGEEIQNHTNPVVADPEQHANFRYLYDLDQEPELPDRSVCTNFSVRKVRLRTTDLVGTFGTNGFNTTMIYSGEGLVDDPNDFGTYKGACIRTQYVEPSYKLPIEGQVTLNENNFACLECLQHLRVRAEDPTIPEDISDPESQSFVVDPCVGTLYPGRTMNGSTAGPLIQTFCKEVFNCP